MSTVAIVDDHRSFADRLALFVGSLPGWEVVGAAPDADAGLALVAAKRPDVALVDVGLPGRNGLWFTEHARAMAPGLRVILMSDGSVDEYAGAAAQVGAVAYVPKQSISRDLPALLSGVTGTDTGGGDNHVSIYSWGFSPCSFDYAGASESAGRLPFNRALPPRCEQLLVGAAVVGVAAAGEPLLGAAAALALITLHWRLQPRRDRRGQQTGRVPQRTDQDR